ncbi:hypothetical protein AB9F34_33165, partial [Rhizobium leguminosarum]|uniref:hypothetical protein n=1 Tax=Rhizobium leguminosarum TaxID=384 RepID=UPI003F979FAE
LGLTLGPDVIGHDAASLGPPAETIAEVAHEAETLLEEPLIDPALTQEVEDQAVTASEPQTEPAPEEIATELAAIETPDQESAAEKAEGSADAGDV